jgi:hypothetical protein
MSEMSNLKIVRLFLPFVILIVFLFVKSVPSYWLVGSLQITLLIHVLIFYLDFFGYFLFDLKINFASYLTSEFCRSDGYKYFSFFGKPLYRSCGVYTEPGTYSNIVSVILVLLVQQKYGLNNRFENIVIVASLFTLILSFSVFGFVFAILITLLKYRKFSVFLILPLMFLSFSYLRYRFFRDSQSVGLGGFELHYNYYFEIINSNFIQVVFGHGLFSPTNDFVVKDVGLVFNMLYYAGSLSLLYMIFLFRKILFVPSFYFALAIILLSKLDVFYVITIFVFALLLRVADETQYKTCFKGR